MKSVFYSTIIALALNPIYPVPNPTNVSGKIRLIETRENGIHAIHLSNPVPPGCSLRDRGLILPGKPGSKGQLAVALAAFLNGRAVEIRVVGCHNIADGHSNHTAPRITKLTIR